LSTIQSGSKGAGHACGRRATRTALALVVALGVGACTRTQSERGVEPRWRQLADDAFSVGQTTQKDVMAALGPPSQVIADTQGTIFYYLYEESRTRGTILVVYNTITTETHYERAIFFFDTKGVLEEYATNDPSRGH